MGMHFQFLSGQNYVIALLHSHAHLQWARDEANNAARTIAAASGPNRSNATYADGTDGKRTKRPMCATLRLLIHTDTANASYNDSAELPFSLFIEYDGPSRTSNTRGRGEICKVERGCILHSLLLLLSHITHKRR